MGTQHVTVGGRVTRNPKLQRSCIHQLLVPDLSNSPFPHFLVSSSYPHIMDKLVAQYSRPQHQNDFYSEAEQQELTEGMPPLSLKFALPPVDNVSVFDSIGGFYFPG